MKSLKIGECLRLSSGETAKVLGLKRNPGEFWVYNFEVRQYHNYYVTAHRGDPGVLVHNQGCDGDGGEKSIDTTKATGGTLFGKSPNKVRKKIKKNTNWKPVDVNSGKGWKFVDENGVERVRYMRPNKNGKFYHEKKGYFRIKDAKGQHLDEHGKIVPKSDPLFHQKTHIVQSGAS